MGVVILGRLLAGDVLQGPNLDAVGGELAVEPAEVRRDAGGGGDGAAGVPDRVVLGHAGKANRLFRSNQLESHLMGNFTHMNPVSCSYLSDRISLIYHDKGATCLNQPSAPEPSSARSDCCAASAMTAF